MGREQKEMKTKTTLLFMVSKFNEELQIYRQGKTLHTKAGSFSIEPVRLLHRWLVFLRKLQVLEKWASPWSEHSTLDREDYG